VKPANMCITASGVFPSDRVVLIDYSVAATAAPMPPVKRPRIAAPLPDAAALYTGSLAGLRLTQEITGNAMFCSFATHARFEGDYVDDLESMWYVVTEVVFVVVRWW
jgi:hypothetical protein